MAKPRAQPLESAMESFTLQLVQLADDGEPRTNTPIISDQYGVGHASVIKLVRRYLGELEKSGRVRFEIQPFHTAGGIQSREIANLNERQTMLLLSLMRNTAAVVGFKVRLIDQFATMSQRLEQRDQSIWQKRVALETRDTSSLAKAQVGSKLMLTRRKEKPVFKKERALLEAEMNQQLFH
jgi:phage regulator Rha-like protein